MTTAYQDMAPDGTLAQQQLLFTGTRAEITAPVLAFASLANGQTFVTITPAGATDSRTINAALAASTDLPTFCAALAADLNNTGGGTTAYDWTATATTVDGTAKSPGSAFNSAPTGTALVGGMGSVTTRGSDPIAGSNSDIIATGTIPAFVAGAASIAPGTDKACRYVIASGSVLAAASALTLATTGSPIIGNTLIACYSTGLGQVLSIVNGGPLAGTIATIEASLTKPKGALLWWDGTNYIFNGYVWLQ